MTEQKNKALMYSRLFLFLVILVCLVYLISIRLETFSNILLVILGFTTVVFVHELGHFTAAKLCDVKVEAFSVFLPPILLGIRKTELGFRIRILPKFFPKENDESEDGLLSFTIRCKAKPGETEYRIGLIPFGGFVKMLGQEDTKEVEANDDPRSYANKSVGVRMAIISAGVLANVVSAVVIFMIVFLIGINRIPPVIGSVRPNSPAAIAGLKAGDEIIKIAGKSNDLEFADVGMAAALSGKDERVKLKVRHKDGTEEDYALLAEETDGPTGKLRLFGVSSANTLTIARLTEEDTDEFYSKTGLSPGDRIKSVNGIDVDTYWELEEIIGKSAIPEVVATAERIDAVSGEVRLIESRIQFDLSPVKGKVESESDLVHIWSMVPRLRIAYVNPATTKGNFLSLLKKIGLGKSDGSGDVRLQRGDIILAAGNVENPTYKELRDVTKSHEGKNLGIKVLRSDANGVENVVTVSVVPKKENDRVVIGIVPFLDAKHAVVAKTISSPNEPMSFEIPRGAVIKTVGGVEVSDFYDVMRAIEQNAGKSISIDYRVNKDLAGSSTLDVPVEKICFPEQLAVLDYIPFEPLEKLYKATGPFNAVAMGYRKTVQFTMNAYLTLQRFFTGLVDPENFMGPVGILTVSYKIVSGYKLIDFAYFIGLISAFIAVFNFLPMLPFDGGHIVFLIIEKIKGSPVSERIQGIILRVGLALVLAFALYVTFNDIARIFRGVFN